MSKRVFLESPFLLSLLRFSGVLRANLKGAEKKRTLQKNPFGEPLKVFSAPRLLRSFGAPPGHSPHRQNHRPDFHNVSNQSENDSRQIPWPFFSQELYREAHLVSANLNGGSEDFHGKGGKIAENRALTDVNRRYFGIYDRFSAVNRR